MDFRQITYFLSIYDAGSFTAASRQEHVAQPALSMQIRRLEEELGVKLFERRANGVVPTPAGAHFYELCKRIVREISATRTEMAAFSKSISGRLSVGLPPSLSRSVLRFFLPKFVDDHPHVDLSLIEAFSDILAQWVKDQTVELAVANRPTNGAGLVLKMVHSEPMMLAGNLPAFGAMLEPVDIRRVGSLKLLLPLPRHQVSRLVEEHLQQLGIQVERIMYVDGIIATLEIIRHSDWCTITPLSVLLPELESHGINVHPLVGAELPYQVFLMHLPRQPLSPAARAFIDALEAGFRDYTAQYKKFFTR